MAVTWLNDCCVEKGKNAVSMSRGQGDSLEPFLDI